nr:hypothetical protein [uncultured Cohaesibacter sp.]
MIGLIVKMLTLMVKLAPVLASLLTRLSETLDGSFQTKAAKGREKNVKTAAREMHELLQRIAKVKMEGASSGVIASSSVEGDSDGDDGIGSECLRQSDGFRRD